MSEDEGKTGNPSLVGEMIRYVEGAAFEEALQAWCVEWCHGSRGGGGFGESRASSSAATTGYSLEATEAHRSFVDLVDQLLETRCASMSPARTPDDLREALLQCGSETEGSMSDRLLRMVDAYVDFDVFVGAMRRRRRQRRRQRRRRRCASFGRRGRTRV